MFHAFSAHDKNLDCMQSLERTSTRSAADVNNSDWSLEMEQLEYKGHLAKGAFGDLYFGTYHGMEVAIKEIRDSPDSPQQLQEFVQVLDAGVSRTAHKSLAWVHTLPIHV